MRGLNRNTYSRARMVHAPHLWVGQEVMLNEEISDPQAQGYGLKCDDPRKTLDQGVKYEISGVDVRRFQSGIYLVGQEGRFNSVCFHAVPLDLPQHT